MEPSLSVFPDHGTCWLHETTVLFLSLYSSLTSYQMISVADNANALIHLGYLSFFHLFILMPNWSLLYIVSIYESESYTFCIIFKRFNLAWHVFPLLGLLVERLLSSLVKLFFWWQINFYWKESFNFINETSTENYNSIT